MNTFSTTIFKLSRWIEAAQYRSSWRSMREAYVQHWTSIGWLMMMMFPHFVHTYNFIMQTFRHVNHALQFGTRRAAPPWHCYKNVIDSIISASLKIELAIPKLSCVQTVPICWTVLTVPLNQKLLYVGVERSSEERWENYIWWKFWF